MKHNINKYLAITLICAVNILNGCHNAKTPDEGNGETTDQLAATGQDEFKVTREQFEASGMKIGKPEISLFREVVSATGNIAPSPNGHARVGSFIRGKVYRVYVSQGQSISKGSLLFELEGNEIILLQQEYAEAYSRLSLLKSNYERQQVLSREQISAEKDLILAESEYLGVLATTEGLKERLKMINIDPSVVEKGKITGRVSVFAPIKGYVTSLDLVVGQSIDPSDIVLQLVDPDQLQLNINIFRKEIGLIEAGQTVSFYEPGNTGVLFEATMSQVGKAVDSETRTIECIATIKPADRMKFVSNSFVEAKVITSDREAPALPSSALIEEGGKYYVLTLGEDNGKEITFIKRAVTVGVILNDLVEIIDNNIKDILIAGTGSLVTD